MRHIAVVIYRDGDDWVGQALNVNVSSFGETPEEARDSLSEALALYFEDDESPEVHEVADPRIEEVRV
jgi:predicted RNase H-like HicB family nuclease